MDEGPPLPSDMHPHGAEQYAEASQHQLHYEQYPDVPDHPHAVEPQTHVVSEADIALMQQNVVARLRTRIALAGMPGIPLNELVYAMKYPQGQLPAGFILETTNVVPLLAQHLPTDLFFVVQLSRPRTDKEVRRWQAGQDPKFGLVGLKFTGDMTRCLIPTEHILEVAHSRPDMFERADLTLPEVLQLLPDADSQSQVTTAMSDNVGHGIIFEIRVIAAWGLISQTHMPMNSHQMKYLPMLGDLGWAVLQYISRFGERGIGHTAIKASFALTDQIDITSYLEAFVKRQLVMRTDIHPRKGRLPIYLGDWLEEVEGYVLQRCAVNELLVPPTPYKPALTRDAIVNKLRTHTAATLVRSDLEWALSQEYAMSRFMALYMELRRDRLVEEFQGRVDGHDRRCTRLCADLEASHPFIVHRHSDVWHVMKLINLRRPRAISMAEIMTRLNMDHARTRVEVILTMMERRGAVVASQPLPWAVATLFSASEKGGLVGMANGIEETHKAKVLKPNSLREQAKRRQEIVLQMLQNKTAIPGGPTLSRNIRKKEVELTNDPDIKVMDRKVRIRLLDKLEASGHIKRTKRPVTLATGKKERLMVVSLPTATEADVDECCKEYSKLDYQSVDQDRKPVREVNVDRLTRTTDDKEMESHFTLEPVPRPHVSRFKGPSQTEDYDTDHDLPWYRQHQYEQTRNRYGYMCRNRALRVHLTHLFAVHLVRDELPLLKAGNTQLPPIPEIPPHKQDSEGKILPAGTLQIVEVILSMPLRVFLALIGPCSRGNGKDGKEPCPAIERYLERGLNLPLREMETDARQECLTSKGVLPVNIFTQILEDADEAGLLKFDGSSGLFTVAASVLLNSSGKSDSEDDYFDILSDESAQQYWQQVAHLAQVGSGSSQDRKLPVSLGPSLLRPSTWEKARPLQDYLHSEIHGHVGLHFKARTKPMPAQKQREEYEETLEEDEFDSIDEDLLQSSDDDVDDYRLAEHDETIPEPAPHDMQPHGHAHPHADMGVPPAVSLHGVPPAVPISSAHVPVSTGAVPPALHHQAIPLPEVMLPPHENLPVASMAMTAIPSSVPSHPPIDSPATEPPAPTTLGTSPTRPPVPPPTSLSAASLPPPPDATAAQLPATASGPSDPLFDGKTAGGAESQQPQDGGSGEEQRKGKRDHNTANTGNGDKAAKHSKSQSDRQARRRERGGTQGGGAPGGDSDGSDDEDKSDKMADGPDDADDGDEEEDDDEDDDEEQAKAKAKAGEKASQAKAQSTEDKSAIQPDDEPAPTGEKTPKTASIPDDEEGSMARRRPRRRAAVSASKEFKQDRYTMFDDTDDDVDDQLEDPDDEFQLEPNGEEADGQAENTDNNEDEDDDGDNDDEINLADLKSSGDNDDDEEYTAAPAKRGRSRGRGRGRGRPRKAKAVEDNDDDDNADPENDENQTPGQYLDEIPKGSSLEDKAVGLVLALGHEPEPVDYQTIAMECDLTMTQVKILWRRYTRNRGRGRPRTKTPAARVLPEKMKRPEKLRRRRGINTSLGKTEDLFVLLVTGISQELSMLVEWSQIAKIFYRFFQNERIGEELRRRSTQMSKNKAAKLDMQSFLRAQLDPSVTKTVKTWASPKTETLIRDLLKLYQEQQDGKHILVLPDSLEELTENYDITGAAEAGGLRLSTMSARQRDFLENPTTLSIGLQNAIISAFTYVTWQTYVSTKKKSNKHAQLFVRTFQLEEIEMVTRQLLARDTIAGTTKRKDLPPEPTLYCFTPRALNVVRLDWSKDIYEETRQAALQAISEGRVTLETDEGTPFGVVALVAEAVQAGETHIPVKFNPPRVGDVHGQLNTRSIYSLRGSEAVIETIELPPDGMTVSAEYIQGLNEAAVPIESRYEMPMIYTPLVTKCTLDDLPTLLKEAKYPDVTDELLSLTPQLWAFLHGGGSLGIAADAVAAKWTELAAGIADESKRPLVHQAIGIMLDSGAIARVPETLLGSEYDGKWRFVTAPNAKDWARGAKKDTLPHCWTSLAGKINHACFDVLAGAVLYHVCQKPGILEAALYEILHPLVRVPDAVALVAYLIEIGCISRIITVSDTRPSFFAPFPVGMRETDVPILHDVLAPDEINAFTPAMKALTTFAICKAAPDADDDESES
eukprot:m.213909 g.213909  ORF g.213909 m.213909 type:complete len:2120 (-) comp17182_c0_seq2:2544-8903(-)